MLLMNKAGLGLAVPGAKACYRGGIWGGSQERGLGTEGPRDSRARTSRGSSAWRAALGEGEPRGGPCLTPPTKASRW